MVLFIDLWCCMHVELNSSFDYADWAFKFFFLEISLLPFLNMFGWINNRWHLGFVQQHRLFISLIYYAVCSYFLKFSLRWWILFCFWVLFVAGYESNFAVSSGGKQKNAPEKARNRQALREIGNLMNNTIPAGEGTFNPQISRPLTRLYTWLSPFKTF